MILMFVYNLTVYFFYVCFYDSIDKYEVTNNDVSVILLIDFYYIS